MLTSVGILIFFSMINKTSESLKAKCFTALKFLGAIEILCLGGLKHVVLTSGPGLLLSKCFQYSVRNDIHIYYIPIIDTALELSLF